MKNYKGKKIEIIDTQDGSVSLRIHWNHVDLRMSAEVLADVKEDFRDLLDLEKAETDIKKVESKTEEKEPRIEGPREPTDVNGILQKQKQREEDSFRYGPEVEPEPEDNGELPPTIKGDED